MKLECQCVGIDIESFFVFSFRRRKVLTKFLIPNIF